MKHSPAPWTLERHEDMSDEIRSSDRNCIAAVYWGDYPEGVANGHLISAAPDLLDSLSRLVDVIHATSAKCGFGVMLTPKNNPCDCSQHDDYHKALAAISKAKGGA